MANKSYASSEIGDESRYGQADPEFSKDFNQAYSKVGKLQINTLFSWLRRSIRSRATLCSYPRMKSTN
jgi:hypothetical protein